MTTTYSAANGLTYGGVTIGSGYDARIRVTGRARNGDVLAVVSIERVGSDEEYLMAARYPEGADLQRSAILLASNPPFDEPDLTPNEAAYDGTDHSWAECCEGLWEELAQRWDEAGEAERNPR